MMVWTLLFVTLLTSISQDAKREAPLNLATTTVESFDSRGTSIVDTLSRFGFATNIPIGIVIPDDSACRTQIDFSAHNELATEALNRLTSQIGYAWSVKDDVVVIEPKESSARTTQLLNIVLPRYAAPEAKIEVQQRYLWMDLRAILRPSEGSILNYATSGADVLLPPIDVHNIRLIDALNRTVSRRPEGEWILLPLPQDITKDSDRPYFRMFSYASGSRDVPTISCTL